jgi:hypothetical protein
MSDKQLLLEEALEAMLADNEPITARGVIRRMSGVFKHATDITRNAPRRALVEKYAKKQELILAAVERTSKKSRSELERLVAEKRAEISRLESEKELLIASHRAMILGMAETGGFANWKRFFDQYQASIDALEHMGALPDVNTAPTASQLRK